MAIISGPQPEIKYCPICREPLHNIPREKMPFKGHVRKDGTISEYTHKYKCLNLECGKEFEINIDRKDVN